MSSGGAGVIAGAFRGPKPGERLGRFRVASAWSTGPLGPTARAKMLATDRAAQVVCLRGATSPLSALQLSRDIASIAGLAEEGVVAPIDAWDDELGLVVAFEEPRGTVLDPRGFDPARALETAIAIARTLAPAHRAGIAHGALAPEMVWLGTDPAVSVWGMGIARWVAPSALMRIAGVGAGRALAPEQVRERAASPASDVHAIGALLFELLTQRPAFHADTASSLFASIGVDAAPSLPASHGEPLRAIVARALAKEPSERFADASALASALEALAQRPTPSARENRPPAADEIVWGRASVDDEASGRSASASRGRTAASGRAPRFSGALAQQQLAFARQQYGASVARALAAIDPADRDEVEHATAISWVRIEAFERFHVALAKELGRDVEATHPELVLGGSRKAFHTLWRMLLRVGGARLVMTRAPVVYGKTYDTGVMESRDIGDTGGKFVLTEWPGVPEFVLRGLRAGMGAALESVGRTGVVMTSTRTADGAVFVARWDR